MITEKTNRRDVMKSLGWAAVGASLVNRLSAQGDPAGPEPQAEKPQADKPGKPVQVIVIGAGNRGWSAYASYGLKFPDELQVVGVAEPVPYRRQRIAEAFGIPPENQFATWEDVFQKPKFADALIIATPDDLHYGPAMAGLKAGYDMLLEKVIAQTWEECNDILQLAVETKAIVAVCHVLRYNAYFRKLKSLIASGEIGEVVSIQHLEPVEHTHMAHSFVRGNWGNSKQSNPMILSKSSHDTDILRWLIDKPCTRTSSFGSLKLFRREMAPAGSTDRCTSGCKVERSCPFSAKKIYLEQRQRLGYLQLEDTNEETIMRELQSGPYGRCVYRCDNDVVDHQVTNFEFEGGITAAFSLEALTSYEGRRTRVFGTDGDITGDETTLVINRFSTGRQTLWDGKKELQGSGHGGGDHGLVHDFVRAVSAKDPKLLSSTIQVSMASHLMGFKAEESRLKGTVESVGM